MICIKNSKMIMSDTMVNDMLLLADRGKIVDIVKRAELPENTTVIDAKGLYLSPGFIDTHVHGGGGFSVMTDDPADIAGMCLAHNMFGTTCIVPATLATPFNDIIKSMRACRIASDTYKDIGIYGINLEGPFLSREQFGAQTPGFLTYPTMKNMWLLLDEWDKIKIIGIAPEISGGLMAGQFFAKHGVRVSIAHSNATFDQVERALRYSFSDVTHIYSGCSSYMRRAGYGIAGVVEAGLYFRELTVSVIADMRHLPESLLRYIYRIKGSDSISLITDGLEFSALKLEPGKRYVQKNGVEAIFEDAVMKLPSREAFVGSVATMDRVVNNMNKYVRVPLIESVKMATLNPARLIGADKKGRLEKGCDSDLILFDDDIKVSFCMIGKKIIKNEL